jgi:LacI family transcriptional regulator
MRVTMVQVAREAGVDKATVSRALKGDPRISLATRERVWEAVKRLGYEPDAVAKGLSSSRSEMVAVVFRSLSPGWTGCFLSGVERVLAKGRMDFMVRSTGDLPGARESLLRTLSARRIDGLIWLDPEMPRLPGMPTVTVGFRLEGALSVLIDQEEGERRLLSLAGETPIRYRPGPDALFRGIGEKYGKSAPGEVSQREWVFCDGTVPANGERAILACGQVLAHNPSNMPLLVWPAFETGVLSARLLLNSLKQQANLPEIVLVQPRLEIGETLSQDPDEIV